MSSFLFKFPVCAVCGDRATVDASPMGLVAYWLCDKHASGGR